MHKTSRGRRRATKASAAGRSKRARLGRPTGTGTEACREALAEQKDACNALFLTCAGQGVGEAVAVVVVAVVVVVMRRR